MPTLDELKALAEAGDVEAMYRVGCFYYKPQTAAFTMILNGKESCIPALEWHGKAAARGHGGALYALGVMHEQGDGTPKNLFKALSYYKQAAATGHRNGLFGDDAARRVQAAIAADPAATAAMVSAAAAAEAEHTLKQRALEQEVAHHEQQVARDRAALEADRARLQSERDAVDAVRREQEAQQQAKEAAAAAFAAAKCEAAAAKQAEIHCERRTAKAYTPARETVLAALLPSKVNVLVCPVCLHPMALGQSQLLAACLHGLCRTCTPHMAQADGTVRCPVCDVVSTVPNEAAPPHHPFVEAELAADDSHACAICAPLPEEHRMPAALKCADCDPQQYYCEPHASTHRKRARTHATTPLLHADAPARCSTHDRLIEACCMDCRALICLACLASTHPAATHATRLLTDTAFVESVRNGLVAGVAAARAVADALVDHAADATVAVAEVDQRDAAVAAEVDRSIDVLVGLLERRRQAMHAQMVTRSHEERAALQRAREESMHRWRIVTSAADLAEQLATGAQLGVNATALMVQLSAAATARLSAVLEWKPEQSVPAPSIVRFAFDEDVGKQIEELGELVKDA